MATKDEIREQKDAAKELNLATINLNRAADGLGAVGLDNRSFLSAFGKDLGKLGAFGKRFNMLSKLQISQFAASRIRNSRINIFAKLRERKAAKLLAKQQDISKKEAKFLIKRANVFKQEQAKIAAEKKYIEQFGVGAEFMAAEAKRKKSESAKGMARNPDGTFKKGGKEAEGRERLKAAKEKKDRTKNLNQGKKILDGQTEHFDNVEKFQKRLLITTLLSNLARGAGGLIKGVLGAIAGAGAFAFKKVLGPLLLLAGLTTFGGDLIDRLIVWLTGERKKIKIPGTDMEVSAGDAIAGTAGTALMFKRVRAALMSMLGFGPKPPVTGGLRVPSMSPSRSPGHPANRLPNNQAAVNRARQSGGALQKIEQTVQNLKNRLSKTFDSIKSAGKAIGEKAKILGKKVPAKLLVKAGTIGLGGIVAGISAAAAPFIAPLLAVGFAAYEGVSAYNRAPELLNLPKAKVNWKQKLEVTFAGVLAGLSFTLASTEDVLAGFDKLKDKLAERRKQVTMRDARIKEELAKQENQNLSKEEKQELKIKQASILQLRRQFGLFKGIQGRKIRAELQNPSGKGKTDENYIMRQIEKAFIKSLMAGGVSGVKRNLGLRPDQFKALGLTGLQGPALKKQLDNLMLEQRYYKKATEPGSIFVHDAKLSRQLDNIFGTSAGNAAARLNGGVGGATVINAPTVAPNNTRNSSVSVSTVTPHINGHANMRMAR